MPRKVLLVNVSGEPYDHSQNPPQSPFMKRLCHNSFLCHFEAKEEILVSINSAL